MSNAIELLQGVFDMSFLPLSNLNNDFFVLLWGLVIIFFFFRLLIRFVGGFR